MPAQVPDIREAINAIRKAASADLAESRSALLEIERQTKLIESLTRRVEVKREADYLMSRALDRFASRDEKLDLVQTLRLHGAVSRFQFALQQLGFLRTSRDSQAQPGSGSQSH